MASKDQLELFSLPGRGRAEVIRMMLVFCGKAYTDNRLTIAQWKIKRKAEGYGEEVKLPVMKVEGKNPKTLIGVIEIARFIALNFGLYGTSSPEQDEINEVIETLENLNSQLNPILRATLTKNYEQRKECWNVFKAESLIPVLNDYESRLASSMFIVGNRISWADIALVEALTRFQACYDSFYLAHFSNLREYCLRFEKLPNMRPYIQSRPDSYF